MKILIASATEMELNVVRNVGLEDAFYLVTGVGVPLTLASLLDFLYWHPVDVAVQVGLAGSFRDDLTIGAAGVVAMDAFADVAWHQGNELVPVYTSSKSPHFEPDGFLLSTMYPFENKGFRAITVNSPTVSDEHKAWLQKHWNPDVESMEGAAFLLACQMRKVPAVQIRSISNYVCDPRSSWQIQPALRSLKAFTAEFLQKIMR